MATEDYSCFDCGFTKADSSISLNDINLFVRAVWLHFTVYRIDGEIQQLREGLINTLNFSQLVGANHNAVWSLFTSKGHRSLSTSFMQEIFLVQYSPDGSNSRIHEEAVIINWFNHLQDCEGMNVVT